jgi:hypothetical protein
MDIEITFINQSYDNNNSAVVIFQKNVAVNANEVPNVKACHPDEHVVAWKVLANHGRDWKQTFKFPSGIYLAAQDSYGNKTTPQAVSHDQQWNIVQEGDKFGLAQDEQPPHHLNQVEVNNQLAQGTVHAQIFRGGNLLAVKQGLAPGQKALFEFTPTIWIGLVAGISEGEFLPATILDNINTEIALTGMTQAKILLKGGGTGPDAAPYEFTIEPVEDFFL